MDKVEHQHHHLRLKSLYLLDHLKRVPYFLPTMPPTLEDDGHGGDTIVVKGEAGWSHPSSPECLSPEIERPAANLPTPSNLQREHISPEPDDYTPSRLGQQNLEPNSGNTRRPKAYVTTMEDRLLLLPEKRPLPWRPGVEEGADIETGGESRRKQIRFGCLLATRGEVQVPGCNSCMNGRGKFSLCVALDGFFKGACASCQLSGRPNRCSIKKEDGTFMFLKYVVSLSSVANWIT